MQRKNPIKWSDDSLKKLEIERQKFNRKIYNARRNPEMRDVLPKPISKSDLNQKIDKFATKWDYNREIKSLQSAREKGAFDVVKNKKGLELTRWEKEDVKKRLDYINRKREEKRVKYDASRGEQSRSAKLSDLRRNKLMAKKLNFDDKKSKEEWELFVTSIENEMYAKDKALIYKQNYLKTVENELGAAGLELYEYVEGLDEKIIANALWEKDELLRIGFLYDPIEQERRAKAALEHWMSYIDNLKTGK